ncbi:MAG: hypothetical protein JOZ73_10545 [Solirubrobacterales bacterium]|nr:hypothetical protein [Solirubrobacterales bacterium]
MEVQPTKKHLSFVLVLAAIIAGIISGCGSSSGDATTLLKQTFAGQHTVNSGNVSLSVSMTPSGSTSLNTPINLTFGGPFQSLGKGKLPKSNFNISVSAQGKTGSLAILSDGTNGYVTLQGTSYQLPAATFQKLQSSFSQTSANSSTNQGTLAKLGIDPLRWVRDPTVVGDETVAGTQTTHIRGSIDVAALLSDLNTFLGKASSASGSSQVPSNLSDSTRQRIASEVKSPSFDVWTGKTDKTLRKLAVGLTFPVTGQTATVLGGLKSARVGMDMQYASLNQPQNIAAPTNVRPFTEFSSKLRGILSQVQGSLLPGGSGSTGSTGSAPSTGGTAPSTGGTAPSTGGASPSTGGASSTPGTGNVQGYSQCIQSAGQDVSKMQQCAALLNGR